jgi:hypothetical protein
MSSTNPYASLSQATLNQLAGLLEPLEGWAGSGVTDVSNGTKLIPTIGYGFNISDPDILELLLSSMTLQAQTLSTTINGQTQTVNVASGNIFSQAAQIASAEGLTGAAIPTAAQITKSLESVIASSTLAAGTDTALTNKLGTTMTEWATGNWKALGLTGPTATGGQSDSFTLTQTQAEVALGTVVVGPASPLTTVNGGALIGKSTVAANNIRSGYNSVAAQLGLSQLASTDVIPGLSPNSAQWMAIVTTQYLGMTATVAKNIGKAIAAGDWAYVWYTLRYVASNPTPQSGTQYRSDISAEMFGLNGVSPATNSITNALEDYAVLTTNRPVIMSSEFRMGENPDSVGGQWTATTTDRNGNTPYNSIMTM